MTFQPGRFARDRAAYAQLFEEADLITVHSNYADARLRRLECPPRLLRRLECGIDFDEFNFRVRHPPADRSIRLLTVGRLVEKKGIGYSIRAVAQLIREGQDLQYEIIGDGPLRGPLTRLAAELGVSDRIAFAGPKDISYVRERMNKSDLFVLASITAADGDTEGAPVSLLEAQASGMPVVSTRHAGIPEIVIDNETGYLAEGDTVALTDALSPVANQRAVVARDGSTQAHSVEERHDLKVLNRRLVGLYEEAAARFAAPSNGTDLDESMKTKMASVSEV